MRNNQKVPIELESKTDLIHEKDSGKVVKIFAVLTISLFLSSLASLVLGVSGT